MTTTSRPCNTSCAKPKGHGLRSENATPRVAAKFYKAVVQAVLLYSSKTWNLTKAELARLERFHVQVA
jgi:hypothetical protein